MSNFHSNYNDIHREIVITDFTDEQIEELLNVLQIKKTEKETTKPQLTKEEKAFFQCCKEHRSYVNGKDLDTVVCPHCGSVKVIKYGTITGKHKKSKGRQRFLCKDCSKTFGDTNGTVAFRSKLSVAQWIEFIKLTIQGESCRTIAKELKINKQTVLHNRHRICSILLQFVSNQDDFKSLAESDEYYYPLSFKDVKDPMFFLGTLGRMPYTHRSIENKEKYVEKQGFDTEFLHTLHKNAKLVRTELLNYVREKDLKSQEKFSNALNGMDTKKIIEVLNTLHEQQKK